MRIYKTAALKRDSENTEVVLIFRKFVKLNGIQSKDTIHNRGKKFYLPKLFKMKIAMPKRLLKQFKSNRNKTCF